MAWYRCEGTKSSEEIHGASITVTAIGNDLVGVACNLYNNTTLVASKVFPSSKVVIFDKLIDSGAYRASITVGDKTVNEGVSISDQDILDGASKSVSISSYTPPSPSYTFSKTYDSHDGSVFSGNIILLTKDQLQEAYNNGYRYINTRVSARTENIDTWYAQEEDSEAVAQIVETNSSGSDRGSTLAGADCWYRYEDDDGEYVYNSSWGGSGAYTAYGSGKMEIKRLLDFAYNYGYVKFIANGINLRWQRVTCTGEIWLSRE